MISLVRHPLSLAVVGAFVLLAGGCAMCSKKKVVPDSLATSRELASEGISAMETGQLDRAQSLLTEAVAASPSDADARRNLAEALWQQGDYRDAAVQIEAAVQLDPRHAPTVVRAGEMLLAVGAYDRAMQRTEQAIRLDSNRAGVWAWRGRLHRQRGETDRALADMHQALRFAPNEAGLLLEVAQIYMQLNKPERSLTTLHCLLDTYPEGEEPQQALWLEGMAYSSLGRSHEAIASLQAATLRGQPRPDLLFQLAQAEQLAGQSGAATSTLRRALAIDGAHEPSRVMLAQLEQSETVASEGVLLR